MFAAMKSGSMASYTPPAPAPQPTSTATNSSSENNRDDSRKAQLKVLGIPDGTDVVRFHYLFRNNSKLWKFALQDIIIYCKLSSSLKSSTNVIFRMHCPLNEVFL